MELADAKSDNARPDDTNLDDVKPEDVKPEDVKSEDVKPEDVKPEDVKPEDVKPEDVKPENKKKWLRKVAEEWFEKFLRILFFWEKDDKRLGKIIRICHRSIMYSFIFGYFIIHTVTTSYFVFILYYLSWGLIWLQHIILGGCISHDIECKLINDNNEGIILPILDLFNITLTPESGDGIVILGSTFVMCILSCELISRTINGIKSFFIFK
jgi:hypothetical protein